MNKFYHSLLIILIFYFFLLASKLYAQDGWSPDVRIGYLSGDHWNPRAAACDSNVHVVYYRWWVENDTVYKEIYYKRSTDAGTTWEDDVLLSNQDDINSIMPDVAVKGDTVIVVWFGYQSGVLEYRRSINCGVTWLPIDTINCLFTLGYPSIDIVIDTVYISAEGYLDGEFPLCFTKSTDGGVTWDSVTQIYDEMFPHTHITVTCSNINIVYEAPDTLYGATEVFNIGSQDGGQTWDIPVIISDEDSVNSPRPFNTSWPGGTAATWYDYKYSPYPWTGDIFFRRKTDSLGNNWDEIDSLTTDHRAVWSDILAESTHLHVVWEDERNDPGNNFEIYYRESTDLGTTWLLEVRLTDASWHSYRPSLACGGGYLHCFWYDRRDYGNNGAGVLYYKRKDLSQSVVETNMFPLSSLLKFDVYPNPFYDILNIRIELRAKGIEKNLDVKLYDILGKEVVGYDLNEKTDRITIDTKDLPCGVYFVQIQAGGESGIRKVIKIK
jgi:hypothetical protein